MTFVSLCKKFRPLTILGKPFCYFFKGFKISINYCVCDKKIVLLLLALFETLKPNVHEMAKNSKIRLLFFCIFKKSVIWHSFPAWEAQFCQKTVKINVPYIVL